MALTTHTIEASESSSYVDVRLLADVAKKYPRWTLDKAVDSNKSNEKIRYQYANNKHNQSLTLVTRVAGGKKSQARVINPNEINNLVVRGVERKRVSSKLLAKPASRNMYTRVLLL